MGQLEIHQGDCLTVMRGIPSSRYHLVYLDPPFLTQRQHSLATRDGQTTYSFRDIWASHEEYAIFLHERITECHRLLHEQGSLFFHCDRNASHIARIVLDRAFGPEMFRSEIIWSYRRWSNSARGLMPSHQNILLYTKSDHYKFNKIITGYSETTNIDQIIQRRSRDHRNKSVYARADDGQIISNGGKAGVALGDVWEIPYLNPKARERVGYPTQKPILLLERIIEISTDAEDWVLDPCCGSGTTLVASSLMGRNATGIDVSTDAIALTKARTSTLVRSDSNLLKKGRAAYLRSDLDALRHLIGMDFHPVQRNKGIDAILKDDCNGSPVLVRIQREGESLHDAISAISRAAREKGHCVLVVVAIDDRSLCDDCFLGDQVHVIPSAALGVRKLLSSVYAGSTGPSSI
jgi:site-specific DNA-methyltransferase (adenine-specific)